MNCCKMN